MFQRTLPAEFIAPCLPTKTNKLPSGGQWLHEIKHDGFRIIARNPLARLEPYGMLILIGLLFILRRWVRKPESMSTLSGGSLHSPLMPSLTPYFD
jgi:hypothetical protein